MAQGKTVQWPAGWDEEIAFRQSHYPTDIWADAQTRWDSKGLDEQATYRLSVIEPLTQEYQSAMSSFRSHASSQGFLASFGAFDLLWVLLAVGTAYRIASTPSQSRPGRNDPMTV
jgi:hypothetical protein